MIILKDTTSLELKLGGSVTSSQLPFYVAYVDSTSTNYTPSNTNGTSNNTTVVTIVSAPSSGVVRTIKYISLDNSDSVDTQVILQINESSTIRKIIDFTLETGDRLEYTDTVGFRVLNSAGELKTGSTGNNIVYPAAGIPISTGSGWSTSITDNSTDWDTAYSWGNHASAGYLTSSAAALAYQPLDSDLTTIAGLTATTDNFIVSVSSAWASRTPSQVKSTLSLNNVENTALSTWAGTSSITTLGTITSGTWHGTAIGDTYISSASTWNAKQTSYTILNTLGVLANASGSLTNDGSGNLSWASAGATLSSITAATGSATINSSANAIEWQWNSISSGIGLKLSSTSTAAASNTQTIFSVNQSGANGTSSQTTYSQRISNTKTGTSSTNVGLDIICSGANNNYAINVQSGRVLLNNNSLYFGTSTYMLEFSGSINSYTPMFLINTTNGSAGHGLAINSAGYYQFTVGMYSSYTAPYMALGGALWNGGSTFYAYGTNSIIFKDVAGDLVLMQNAGLTYATTFTPTETFRFKVDGTFGIGVTSPTAYLSIKASTTSIPHINLVAGSAPSSPSNGDIWFDGTDLKMRIGGVTKTFTLT